MSIKEKKRNSVFLMIIGVIILVTGIIAYVAFSSFENGKLDILSAPTIVISLYKLLGTTGVLGVSVIVGAGLYSWGKNRYAKLSKEERNNKQ